MKKFLLMVFVIFFTCIEANATSQVFFTNTGRPSYRVSGAYRSVRPMHNFGSNARFAPTSAAHRAQIRNRAIQRHKAMPRSMAQRYPNRYGVPNTPARQMAAQPSRLNKNYTISTQKTYSRNGITYYN